jgi:hypothetical protein
MQNMQNPWGKSQIDGIAILILPVLFLWESWRANSRTVSGALVLVSKREVISIAVKNFVNPPCLTNILQGNDKVTSGPGHVACRIRTPHIQHMRSGSACAVKRTLGLQLQGLEVVAHELPLPAVSDVQLRHKIFHPCGLVELSRWAPVSRSLLQGIGNGMWEISGLEE